MLIVRNLSKTFEIGVFGKRRHRAVSDVSFSIDPGETLGLVGDSGSGKSTVARCILRLVPADGGEVYLGDASVFSAEGKELRALRRRMQIIFQHPYASLNPGKTVLRSLTEPMAIHGMYDEKGRVSRIKELCGRLELHTELLCRYPFQLSGGQLQRAVIARALSLEPEFLVLDEPTSMLDLSVQAAILRLLRTLQRDSNLTYLFISHDIDVVRFMSGRIAEMEKGEIVSVRDNSD